MAKKPSRHSAPSSRRRSILPTLLILLLCLGGVLLRRGGTGSPPPEPTPDALSAAVEVSTPVPATPAPTEPPAAPAPTLSPYAPADVRISEVCCVNLAMVQDEDGNFGDWVELVNSGESAVDLGGWTISDKEQGGWVFGENTLLESGARMLVFCDGQDAQGEFAHTDFSLRAGETVYLRDPAGDVRSSLSTEGLARGQSAALQPDGSVAFSSFVTPGYENSEAGYLAWQESLVCESDLRISECVSSNHDSFFHYGGGGYNDWVEVCNYGDQAINMGGYYLSDNAAEPTMWPLPAYTLFPGNSIAFLCSGDESLTEQYFTHTNFKIDAQGEGVYLFDAQGKLVDHLYVHDVPCNGSIGRNGKEPGAFLMEKSSPHKDNEPGYRLYADNPTALSKDGVFDGVDSVTVEFAADKTIYYTTDGSVPTTSSPVYSGPITLTETTVIRASCCEEGKLTPRPVTQSFILNENHTLPVVSVVSERDNLFGAGIYDQWARFDGRQVPASLSFYEGEESFTVDCGLKMFGHTGLKNAKKSMKVLFRSRFGADSFTYDIFGDGNDTFSSFVLRAGQDSYYAVIRDELFQELSAEFSDKVLVQRNKYCVLYINGEYWGLYALKDAYSEEYYAALRGVSPESVERVQAPAALGSSFHNEIIRFAEAADMSVEENYRKFCEMVDIDSLIDWAIIEGYSANADVQQNLRYFRSTENGNKWEFAFYDLDWAAYYENNLDCVFWAVGEDGNVLQHCRYIYPLLANEEFCDRFCTRLAEALGGPLSEERVMAKIDELCKRIEGEIPADHQRWHMQNWETQVESLRAFLSNDWNRKIVDGAVEFCGLTPEEREYYFGALPGE